MITILLFAISAIGGQDIEPIEPVEIKISDMQPAKTWELTGAIYRKVLLPDGSKVELKSREALPDGEWLKLADRIWQDVKEEAQEPKICPHCGRPMP